MTNLAVDLHYLQLKITFLSYLLTIKNIFYVQVRIFLYSFSTTVLTTMKVIIGIASVFMTVLITSSTVLFFVTTKTEAQFDNCDPSYPDVYIVSQSPDLDCNDISDKKFPTIDIIAGSNIPRVID
jgi:hypothetical protein